jgi:hypothetical protein
MLIEIPLLIALAISLGANLLGFYYIRDILGRLGWFTQNLMTLNELLQGYQKHIQSVYELEQFYGDESIKTLADHSRDLIEVLEDYIDIGLDAELIEDEEVSELSNKDEINEKETKKE